MNGFPFQTKLLYALFSLISVVYFFFYGPAVMLLGSPFIWTGVITVLGSVLLGGWYVLICCSPICTNDSDREFVENWLNRVETGQPDTLLEL